MKNQNLNAGNGEGNLPENCKPEVLNPQRDMRSEHAQRSGDAIRGCALVPPRKAGKNCRSLWLLAYGLALAVLALIYGMGSTLSSYLPLKADVVVSPLGVVADTHYIGGLATNTEVRTTDKTLLLQGIVNLDRGEALEARTWLGQVRVCVPTTQRCATWMGQ